MVYLTINKSTKEEMASTFQVLSWFLSYILKTGLKQGGTPIPMSEHLKAYL